MGAMEGWDLALLVAAAYVAVTALVRLMLKRREQLVAQFRDEIKATRDARP